MKGQLNNNYPSIEEYIEELQVDAVSIGISIFDFWQLTIAELSVYFKAFEAKTRRELEAQYNQAALIGINVAARNPWCEGKVSVPTLQELYPQLYKAELENKEQEDWQVTKERLLKFAELHNKQLRGEK